MTVCIDGVKTNRPRFKRITVIRHVPETVETALIKLSLNISFDIMVPQNREKRDFEFTIDIQESLGE